MCPVANANRANSPIVTHSALLDTSWCYANHTLDRDRINGQCFHICSDLIVLKCTKYNGCNISTGWKFHSTLLFVPFPIPNIPPNLHVMTLNSAAAYFRLSVLPFVISSPCTLFEIILRTFYSVTGRLVLVHFRFILHAS